VSATAFTAVSTNAVDAYSWFVSGPNGFSTASSAQNFSFTPTVPGAYTVKLTVRDAVGVATVRTQTVNVVADVPKITRLLVPTTAPEGSVQVLNALAFEAGTTTSVPTYHWAITGPAGFSATFETAKIRVLVPDNGAYTATLTVTAANGKTATKAAIINVTNVAPTVTLFTVPDTARILKPVVLSVTATDPAGRLDTLRYAWTITGPSSYRKTFTVRAPSWSPPAVAGNYTVSVRVSDEDGGISVVSSKVVKVTF
jgi:PKD repeat protein